MESVTVARRLLRQIRSALFPSLLPAAGYAACGSASAASPRADVRGRGGASPHASTKHAPSSGKAAIRRRMLERRRQVAAATLTEASRRVFGRLRELPSAASSGAAAGYAACGGEVDVEAFCRWWLSTGRPLYLPRFRPDRSAYVLALVCDYDADLQAGAFGIAEPRPECPDASPDVLLSEDLLWLVPGVAFAADGGARLGRGGGYYDRLMAGARGTRIGVGYDWQVVDSLPVDPHDVLMDSLVTDERVLDTAAGAAKAGTEALPRGERD